VKTKFSRLALIFCVMVSIFLIPQFVNAATEGNFTYTVSGEKATITSFSSDVSGEVVIPSKFGDYVVTAIAKNAFADCSQITKITVPDSVTSIGESAFKGCSSLEEITLPFVGISDEGGLGYNMVFGHIFGYSSSKPTSGDYVYQKYGSGDSYYKYYYIPSSLKKVTITKDTGLYDGAFYGCKNLTEINLPDTLKSIGEYALYNCSGIKSINICEGVTSIGYNAFANCSNLAEITIPKTMTSIGSDAFLNCTSISKTKMNDLELWCKITFDSATANPTYYSKNLYLNDSLLTEVVIPDSITKVKRRVFFNCDDIKKITVPDSVTSIGCEAFQGCNSLEEITLPFVGDLNEGSTSISSVLGYVFGYSITKPASGDYVYQKYGSGDSYYEYYYIPSSLKKVTITKDTGLSYGAFYGCSNLTEINLPENLATVGTDAFYGTKFYNDASSWDDGKVLYVDNILVLGSTSISGSYKVREGTTSIVGSAFASNTKLTELLIPDSVKYIGTSAFSGNTSLKTVVLGSGVKNIGNNAFYNCKAVTDVLYRGTNLDWETVTIGTGNDVIANALIGNESIYVYIVDQDGNTVATDITTARTTFDGSIVPDKAEHTYKLYADKEMTTEFDTSVILMKDTIVYVKYTINQYTYTFYNDDGTVFKSVTADYGSEIKAPAEIPEKEKTAQYTYLFVKWNDYSNGLTLTKDVSYTPYFEPVLNRYTYVFEDAQGNVFEKATIDFGTVITKPVDTPSKSATDQYSFTFAGWDGYSEGMTISGDINFKPVYTPVLNRYTYTFLDGDGTVIKSGSLPYGQVIPLPDVTPTRNKGSQYSYVFEKWDLYDDGMTISSDITFNPVFKEILNKYTYKFVDETGKIYFEETAQYGSEIKVPDVVPVKESTDQYNYSFIGWSGYTYGMKLTKDVTFVAEFESNSNSYTYKFLNEDGSIFFSKTAEYGSVIILPESTPQKEGAYEFDHWEGYTEGMILSGNTTFTAMFKTKSFNITVYDFETLNTTAVYDSEYFITPASKTGFKFEGYYTLPDGNGKKLTDDRGYSILKYDTVQDMTVYAYFTDALLNELVIAGDTKAEIGKSGLTYKVSFGTDKEAQYALIAVKYPNTLTVTNVKPLGFVDVSLDSVDTQGEDIVNRYLCIYSYEGENIPVNKAVDAFELTFDLSTKVQPGDIKIEFTSDSVIMGNEDYNFEVLGAIVLTAIPKLAESVEISGDGEIAGAAKYIATVYPDYTTDKSVEWSVSDDTIAKITSDGVVTPIKKGTVKIIATSVSNPLVKAEKEIVITQATSVISTLTTNTGYWIDNFAPDKREYTIIVDKNVTSLSFTPTYVYGTLKYNGSTMLSGRAKSVALTGDTTIITFERLNVPDCDDSAYTITVIKSDDSMLAEQTDSGKINVKFNKAKMKDFENANLIAVLYDGAGKIIDISSVKVSKDDKDAEIEFSQKSDIEKCKIMLWESFSKAKPLCADMQMTLK